MHLPHVDKLSNQTTTCCYYGTLHLEATKVLADIVHSLGQRAFVGVSRDASVLCLLLRVLI